MAYWGCLKIFTSENDSFRHQVQQIPMFDVWAFKDALFAHFLNDNSVYLDQMLTDFQLLTLKHGQTPLSFVSLVEAKAEELTDCGHGDIEDSVMKTRIYKGLTGCQTLQDFLFTYFQDPSVSYFKFRAALKLRSETSRALTMTTTDNISGKKRGRDGGDDSRQVRGSANSAKIKIKGKANFTEGKTSKNSPNHSSKNKSYSQKHGGKKHWQGHKGQQHDSPKSHYQPSTTK